jgi:hypothetical protein
MRYRNMDSYNPRIPQVDHCRGRLRQSRLASVVQGSYGAIARFRSEALERLESIPDHYQG